MRTPPYPLVASFCTHCRREQWHKEDMPQYWGCKCYKGAKWIHFYLKGHGFDMGEWTE